MTLILKEMQTPLDFSYGGSKTKLLRVTANHFKNCADGFTIDLAAFEEAADDKETEQPEIADGLFAYSALAITGKNASGKTTALDLLDACYSILGNFRLENKHWDYNGVELEMFFFYEGYIYRYRTTLAEDSSLGNRAAFVDEHLSRKKYCKTAVNAVFDEELYEEMDLLGVLPEDTSCLFFVLQKKATRALYFDSLGMGANTYQRAFEIMRAYDISPNTLSSILHTIDQNISALKQIDSHNYILTMNGEEKALSDSRLLFLLSSGTTKGLLLYTMAAASLQHGFDLIVDDIENCFSQSLAENVISLYKNTSVNKNNASLIFSTHCSELLNRFGSQDAVLVCRSEGKIRINKDLDCPA